LKFLVLGGGSCQLNLIKYLKEKNHTVIVTDYYEDALGKKYATEHGIEYQEFPADWERFGKSAGFERNKYIVTAADVVVAFWDGKSKGTEHTLEIAKKQKKPTIVEFF